MRTVTRDWTALLDQDLAGIRIDCGNPSALKLEGGRSPALEEGRQHSRIDEKGVIAEPGGDAPGQLRSMGRDKSLRAELLQQFQDLWLVRVGQPCEAAGTRAVPRG